MIAREFLKKMFAKAVEASMPDQIIDSYLPVRKGSPTIVVGAGKASASMAASVEQQLDSPVEGVVVTRYGHSVETNSIEVIEANHPVPDEAGLLATRRIMDIARSASQDDFVLCLISGGASSLLVAPAFGVELEQKKEINRLLLQAGAPIEEINIVRRALSSVKGGKLAQLIEPACSHTLVISDVPGDDIEIVGSGPTVFDSGNPRLSAIDIVEKYRLSIPRTVSKVLQASSPVRGNIARHPVSVIANSRTALAAAEAYAFANNVTPLIVGDNLAGESTKVALDMAATVERVVSGKLQIKRPCVLLSGGETSVTLSDNSGPGGRNTEFLLALTIALAGSADFSAIACDTDGIDGYADNAGALADSSTLVRALKGNLDAKKMLRSHQAYSFFKELDDLVMTGPTLTNVNDFRAILLE